MSKALILEILGDVADALRLPDLEKAPRLRLELSVSLYSQGFLGLGKAAQLARLSRWEMNRVLDERKVPMHYGSEELAENLQHRGARNLMKLSLPRAARAVMKIHAAALMTKQKHVEVEVNPVMDGVDGVVSDRSLLEAYLKEMMTALALVFVNEQASASRFMVRAGVAFRPIVPGRALAEGAKILRESKEFLNGAAIGMAITHAYEAESCASPFGVYIHESARAFSPGDGGGYPYRTNLWQWFDDEEPLSWALRRTIQEHFTWLEKNPIAAQYEADAMRRHKALATEYFQLHAL